MAERFTRTYEVMWRVGGGVYSREPDTEYDNLDDALFAARIFLDGKTTPYATVQVQRIETEVNDRG